ncbi:MULTISPECIES: FAD-dependent monooxygenase [Pseudomonadota]|uniref:FAD-binding protein n=1 Tax=Pseudomonas aeruginosa TaxID=287 RepID=A0A844NUI1_PSEAI|nr:MULTISPECIES: FAD-dependent monooxygenase [Pseudomonadota]MCW3543580.1 FAD-dependent monooxygenase [Burkholderia cenocepacia]MDO5948303.1 FAD-dependent monooxygenase [Burkholderia cepacia]MUI39609.1 FAD-binding protein [Pseudomonas aeruginosa]ULH02020.1 FAD-dependent monooxygenase [Aeromonas caviae]HBO7046332.1 FAD-binding protein [Pseudomonas aeruginosa]
MKPSPPPATGNHDADAIVVGGGLAGAAAAIAVAAAGLRTIHLAPAGPPDRRTSALMMPSVDYLRGANLVDDPAALGHALTAIRIIDATGRLIRAPETLFEAAEAGLPAFGWNFANARLLERFRAVASGLANLETRDLGVTEMAGSSVTLGDGSRLSAPLIVGADGKKSLVRAAAGFFRTREHAFSQAALVCDLDLGRPIGGTSIEFHYPRGPFTLVPAGDNRANLVWIDDRDVLEAAKQEGGEALVARFRDRSQRLFGSIAMASPAFVFPLSTLSVDVAGGNGVVLVGEAAHAFPPIGAQGLNLGLRDVADLAAALAANDRTAPDWAEAVSADYARRRASDLRRTGGMVDTLFRSLLADMIPAQALRAGGLWALKLAPALRREAFAVGMGKR